MASQSDFVPKRDENEIIVRRPAGQRVLTGLVALIFGFLTFAALSPLLLPDPTVTARNGPPGAFEYTLFFSLALLLAGMTLLFLILAGPCELHFDLRQRTYRYKRGVPLLAKTTTGPLSDLARLSIRTTYVSNTPASVTQSRGYLVWKIAPRLLGVIPQPEYLLFTLTDRTAAETLTDDLGKRLGIPVTRK